MLLRRYTLLLVLVLATLTGAGKDDKPVKDPKADAGAGEGLINKMLAPGPLIDGHKNLEHGTSDCLKCHETGSGVPDPKCLSCHTDISKSKAEKNTFHGLVKQPCIGCHSDHKGRSFDSTKINQASFNHAQTGFPLRGAHSKLSCAKCHHESKHGHIRFFAKSETCISCHKKDDVHFFTGKFAGKECSTCHSDTTWKGAKFDHKKETGYPLVGAHVKVTCAKCHLPKGKGSAKYKFPELGGLQCLACHAKDDPHKGNLDGKFRGGNCSQCHSQDTWKIGKFDHAVTGFALKGKHAVTPCVGCHIQKGKGAGTPQKDLNFTGLKTDCNSCHKDFHGFQQEKAPKLGALLQCQTCHTEAGWHDHLTFNHNTQTNYPINGKHVGVKCFQCHTTKPGQKKGGPGNQPRFYAFPGLDSKTCELCHKSPHKDSPAGSVFKTQKCNACHTTDGWKIFKGGNGFNHSTQTRFPLTGNHAKVTCDGCHLKGGKQVFKFAGAEKGFCEACHKSPHKDEFDATLANKTCATCHDTVTWKSPKFNHDTARFKLTGAHAALATNCGKCHTPTNKPLVGAKPPRMQGKFVFEHQQFGFCVECHKNPHKDQFDKDALGPNGGDDCQRCHNVVKWTELTAFDHDKTRFKIQGAHLKIKSDCVKCHVKTDKIMPGSSPPRQAGKFLFAHSDTGFCEACHKSVHADEFTAEFKKKPCSECHVQTVWNKRKAFDHDTTDFKIEGAHEKFKDNCAKCHVKTPDKMLPTNPPRPASKFIFEHKLGPGDGYCAACHAVEHKSEFHDKLAGQVCLTCHTQADFVKNKFDHKKMSRYELKGKHLKVKCHDCHTPVDATYKEPPHHHKGIFLFDDLDKKDCALCHKDPHKGQFGKKCSTCHTEDGWGQTANFHKDFVLTGVHYLLDCSQCHVEKRVLTGTGNDCKICHQKDDNHMGTQPDCAQCHNQHFWESTRFNHAMTAFPLRGFHRTLECSDCHKNGVYEGKSPDCISCHLEDALLATSQNHKTAGFQQCETCHSQFTFHNKSGK